MVKSPLLLLSALPRGENSLAFLLLSSPFLLSWDPLRFLLFEADSSWWFLWRGSWGTCSDAKSTNDWSLSPRIFLIFWRWSRAMAAYLVFLIKCSCLTQNRMKHDDPCETCDFMTCSLSLFLCHHHGPFFKTLLSSLCCGIYRHDDVIWFDFSNFCPFFPCTKSYVGCYVIGARRRFLPCNVPVVDTSQILGEIFPSMSTHSIVFLINLFSNRR